MGWQEARSSYALRGNEIERAETLVTRRVLRGLGMSPSAFRRYSRGVDAAGNGTLTQWERCRDIMDALMPPVLQAAYRNWVIEVHASASAKPIYERFQLLTDITEAPPALPLMFVRHGGVAKAYVLWQAQELARLQPPYLVAQTITPGYATSPLLLTVQEVSAFIKQFGPYDMEHLS